MKKETYILLTGFKLIDFAAPLISKNVSKEFSYSHQKFKEVLEYWRVDESLPIELYSILRDVYPDPIPFSLFFSYKDLKDIENIKWIGDLADKWLMDIFSGESFYKKNKEYFKRPELRLFLDSSWIQPSELKTIDYTELVKHYFNAKIKSNNLELSVNVFVDLINKYFSHKYILKKFLIFINNNRKRIRNEEIISISDYIYYGYYLKGLEFEINNHSYKGIKWLTDLWYFSSYLEHYNDRFSIYKDNKIVKDYIQFICKNLIRKNINNFSVSKITDYGHFIRCNKHTHQIFDYFEYNFDEYYYYSDYDYYNHDYDDLIASCWPILSSNDAYDILDILDFLVNQYIETNIDFDFRNRSWRGLKRLSEEWHGNINNNLAHLAVRLPRLRHANFLANDAVFDDNIEADEADIDAYYNEAMIEDEYIVNDNENFNLFLDRENVADFEKNLNKKWEKSKIKDFIHEKNENTWTITEITTGRLLFEEGQILHHCCFMRLNSYINKSHFIFSVKCKNNDEIDEIRKATVEITSRYSLVEARGDNNRSIDKETMQIIGLWAKENNINIRSLLF